MTTDPKTIDADAAVVTTESSLASSKSSKGRWWDRTERWLSTLAVRNQFWYRLFARSFLPLAYRSGIRFRDLAPDDPRGVFECLLPFQRFNRNFYNAMAGGSLLANSEIAGGLYLFRLLGADYTVVCKNLQYRFRRPCLDAALYHIDPRGDVNALINTDREFNITIDLKVSQIADGDRRPEKLVGLCEAIFHVTPKAQYRLRQARRGNRQR